MFVDFERTINQKPLSQSKVPEIILARMSDSLPEELYYISNEDGLCIITSKADEMTIGDLVLADDDAKMISQYLGDSYSSEDLAAFSYNSQHSLKFKTKKEGIVRINKHEIPISDYVKKPLDSIEMKNGSFYAIPQPFPEPIFITISNDEFSMQVKVHRVPDYSVDIAVFESCDKDVITLRYKVNENTNEFHCSVSLHVERAKTIEELVQALTLYYSFVLGEGKIENVFMPRLNVSEDIKKSVHSNLVFWNKILELKPVLNIDFKPTIDDIQYEDLRCVEELYQGLIENKTFYSSRNVTSVKSEFNFKIDDIERLKGNKIAMKFNGSCNYELLGNDISIPCNIYVVNAIAENIISDDTETELFIKYDSDSHTIIRMFLDSELQEKDLNDVDDVPTNLESVVSIKDIIETEYVINEKQ